MVLMEQIKHSARVTIRPAVAAPILTAMLFSLAATVKAQTFTFANNDLVLGLRKTGIHQESYEAVVNIGSGTNYVNLSAGTTIPVPNFTPSQLVQDTFSDLDFLSWSVVGSVKTNTASVLPGYQNNTLWLTVPRPAPATQSSPPARLNFAQQGAVATQIKSILSSASLLSSQTAPGPNNTAKFLREPVNNPASLSAFVGSVVDSARSTLHDSWTSDLETTTPANFSGSSVADFYEVRPTVSSLGDPVVDPHTGQSSGDAYYLGYFTLKVDGTVTFTRDAGVVVNPPPSAPTLTVSREGVVSKIGFVSEKNATYTLYSIDSEGLGKPLNLWTVLAGKVTGDGAAKEFLDTTGEATRFYRVSAQ